MMMTSSGRVNVTHPTSADAAAIASGFFSMTGLSDSELLLTSSFEDSQLRPTPSDPLAGFSDDPNLPKRLYVTNIPYRFR